MDSRHDPDPTHERREVTGATMACRKLHSLLSLHAGGDLDAREAARVDAHLRGCLACFRDWTRMRELLATVRAGARAELRSEAVGESIVAGVMRAIDGPPPPALRWTSRLSVVSGWAAAVVLGATLGWSVLRDAAPAAKSRPAAPIVPGGSGGHPLIHTIGDELGRQLDELPAGGAPERLVPPRERPRKRNL